MLDFANPIFAVLLFSLLSLVAAVIGAVIAALLYLVTEKLLVDAHEETETPLSTGIFFASFLLFLLTTAPVTLRNELGSVSISSSFSCKHG